MKDKKSNIKKWIIAVSSIIIIFSVTVFMYEIITVDNTYYLDEKNLQIPILVYHNIVEDESEIEYDYMQSTVETFEKQIIGLIKLGYKPISYEDLIKYRNGEKPISKWSFLITFDDGYEGVYEFAFKIAKKHNIPMTSFIIDDCIGTDGYYTWDNAKEMHDSGLISIYSHGLTHVEYNKKDVDELVVETNSAYNNIIANLEDDNILKVFAYPYGLYTEEHIEALEREGYIQNLMDSKINQSNSLDLSKLHRFYPLNDSYLKIFLKIRYIIIRYGE